MYVMSIYSLEVTELVWRYVDAHFDAFCHANEEDDVSCLEFALNNFCDFKSWAYERGFIITEEC